MWTFHNQHYEDLQKRKKNCKRYINFISSITLVTDDEEPSCYQEAIDNINGAKWKVAMKKEINDLKKNRTWDLVELPNDRKVV